MMLPLKISRKLSIVDAMTWKTVKTSSPPSLVQPGDDSTANEPDMTAAMILIIAKQMLHAKLT